MAVFGVIDLAAGHTVRGIALLVCVVLGVPSFVLWRRRFR
jgi:hypothetical protein